MSHKHIDIDKVMSELTLEEKISLVGGKDFWCTRDIPRLGVPSAMMCDGPTGLRKSVDSASGNVTSVPATCFPTAVVLASTWNRAMVEKVGKAIGKECRAENVSLLLAPGNNIKRSPLCGRNFEYYSEDPYAAGQLAGAYVKGVQSEGVGATLKHYCANNQEAFRFSINELIDERTLREIYLAAFESIVKEAQPWSIMACYNRVNNEYVVSSRHMLTDVLRGEFGFKGFVVSDWGAVSDRGASVNAGMDLEMPGTGGATSKRLLDLAKEGKLNMKELDVCARRILEFVNRAAETLSRGAPKWDVDAHHGLAREAAAEGIVLLKNEHAVLPLHASKKIAVIGEFAEKPRYQGGGSSFVNATKASGALEELKKLVPTLQYAAGYATGATKHDEALRAKAVEVAAGCDAAVVFIGLSDADESEGFDRAHMRLPEHHNALVEAVAAANKHTVVVLTNASAVEMPWASKVQAIVEAYLPGQAGGLAVADVLMGKVNPSGKLSESFPKRLEDTSAYLSFPGTVTTTTYSDGVYVGYRCYDKRRMDVLFPFGHGLSYTTFEYSAPRVAKAAYVDNEAVHAEVTVTNTGKMAGSEVVQLYVRDVLSSIDRPAKELKGFEKVHLAPGESKTVKFTLDRRAFAYYDVARKDWVVEEGDFELLFGSSSRDVRGAVHVKVSPAAVEPLPHFDVNTPIGVMLAHPATAHFRDDFVPDFEKMNISEGLKTMEMEQIKYQALRRRVSFSNGEVDWDWLDGKVAEMNKAIAASKAR
ncbi:putative glycoside hydrolase family 3 [Leptomonas pyrrhocoris]|uniref:beta-glucosidase n=1 Tax=Leptomonas pyrrhocoris TaxID=157538 RepID=A0A0M9GAH9_LEPPY|nr:putative glycoside hydrolase family 3 [Leptomonas pyrrhocoris]KPA86149.1 putative glycoside hydrolase family 3 [Leptomonas pyrrhocoris]|eukprot:XP_015664588.1 putative glycoside hydrolase family 3 [Leptomonas pyrrhocoris]